jgi:hypothetical protein
MQATVTILVIDNIAIAPVVVVVSTPGTAAPPGVVGLQLAAQPVSAAGRAEDWFVVVGGWCGGDHASVCFLVVVR